MPLDPARERRLRALATRLGSTRAERDQEIRAAHAAGGGLREIARAVGMTHQGVKNIIDQGAKRA
jgi:hypothetical protein